MDQVNSFISKSAKSLPIVRIIIYFSLFVYSVSLPHLKPNVVIYPWFIIRSYCYLFGWDKIIDLFR
ncbi:hypothetical protein CI610_03676 [invertebrate metagenome]|uniref:Uncharacterized protein n=1 Tax=invertebrate metagenome TaxID=1711999 RepID=A0A2H9T2F1_9ZZZZ